MKNNAQPPSLIHVSIQQARYEGGLLQATYDIAHTDILVSVYTITRLARSTAGRDTRAMLNEEVQELVSAWQRMDVLLLRLLNSGFYSQPEYDQMRKTIGDVVEELRVPVTEYLAHDPDTHPHAASAAFKALREWVEAHDSTLQLTRLKEKQTRNRGMSEERYWISEQLQPQLWIGGVALREAAARLMQTLERKRVTEVILIGSLEYRALEWLIYIHRKKTRLSKELSRLKGDYDKISRLNA